MNEILVRLAAATLLLSVSAVLMQGLMLVLRPSSARVRQCAWFCVLIQGIVLFHLPIPVPWYDPPPNDRIGGKTQCVQQLSAESLSGTERIEEETAESASATPVVRTTWPSQPSQVTHQHDWSMVVVALWVSGIVGLIIFSGLSYAVFLRQLAQGQPGPSDWAEELRELLQQHGIVRMISLLVTRSIGPALCWAPWSYRICVPGPSWAKLAPTHRRQVLRHELAHFERADLWTLVLVRLLALPHWFNPFAWWVVHQISQSVEWSCDEAAAGRKPEEAVEFAKALVQLGVANSAAVCPARAAGRSSLSIRIRRLMLLKSTEDSRMKKMLILAVAAGLVIVNLVRIELIAKEPGEGTLRLEAAPANPGAPGAVNDGSQPMLQEMRKQSESAAVGDKDQSATKEGSTAESTPVPAYTLTAESNTDQAKAISEIKKLGGTITMDEKSPGKPVVSVGLVGRKVTDAGLANVKGLTKLQSLYLFNTNVTDAGLEHLQGLTKLQSLILKMLDGTQITDAGLERLQGLTKLQSLHLIQANVTDAGLANLRGLTKLQSLCLVHANITDAGLANLKGLTQLQSLNLAINNVTDAGLVHLKGLSKLQSLNLGLTKVTDAGLVHLKGLSKLQSLGLGLTKVTDAGLANVQGFPQLQSLDLGNTKVSDAGLVHLKGLSKLQSLGLMSTEVTDAGLANLKRFPQLQSLELGTATTDAGLVYLRDLSKLQSLGLRSTKVTDAGLANVQGFPQLQSLDLGNTKVTDAGLVHLKGLSKLQSLGLMSTEVTDDGLANIKGLTQLKSLTLGGTKVTDTGLVYLKELSRLNLLNLTGCNVTDAGVNVLQKALPNCEIIKGKFPREVQILHLSPQGFPLTLTAVPAASPDPASPKANDQSGKTSAAKPADELSPASDQSGAKEGSKTESKPAPTRGLMAEPKTEEAKSIAEIKKVGSEVTGDEKSPGKPLAHPRLAFWPFSTFSLRPFPKEYVSAWDDNRGPPYYNAEIKIIGRKKGQPEKVVAAPQLRFGIGTACCSFVAECPFDDEHSILVLTVSSSADKQPVQHGIEAKFLRHGVVIALKMTLGAGGIGDKATGKATTKAADGSELVVLASIYPTKESKSAATVPSRNPKTAGTESKVPVASTWGFATMGKDVSIIPDGKFEFNGPNGKFPVKLPIITCSDRLTGGKAN